MQKVSIVVAFVFVAACGGDDQVHHQPDAPVAPDACGPSQVTIDVVAPVTYACHELFKSKVTLTNGSCAALTVSAIKLTTVVTAGQCGAPGVGMYPGMTVAAGQSAAVLDLTSGAFCCLSPGCPTPLECDEEYTFELTTPSGMLSAKKTAHLSLGGCDVICP